MDNPGLEMQQEQQLGTKDLVFKYSCYHITMFSSEDK